ncbi:CO dehydrogenase flavoprotein-like, FAD-binding, subdomain 2 [Cynara cardunculus var. scolymus]|uniref:L-gulonolactone oxidase n=1 Tax=Cynara cardunculus var. scolymus TaxID=59895 RepID=A0A103XUK4_CYNCS|nr:CO dehydrogenase flavoprotein-like, FAD-binding, subdomain 2 [Cynara cardunculus var. scolymus]
MLLSTPVSTLKWAFLMTMITTMVTSNPPEEPIKCSTNLTNCNVTNSYGAFPDRTTCRAAEVTYPSSEQDLIAAVATATQAHRKMRVATRYSHSIPKLVCPAGDDGLVISTEKLNRVIEIDKDSGLMTLESGVTLRQLIDEASKNGLALPYTPYWWGLTIGGLLGTGAHGSTLWGNGSAVYEYVVQMRMVAPGRAEDGYAKVWTLEENGESDGDMKAARVTLRLQPLFKRSITFLTKNDTDLSDQVTTFGRQHEFADITWYPSQKRVVYRIDDRVSSNVSGNGLWDHPGFRATPSLVLLILRSSARFLCLNVEEDQEAKGDVAGKCSAGKLTTDGYPVVGYQNRLQASGGCLKGPKDAGITACPWDPRVKGLFFHQTTFSIVLSKAKDFIQDIQKLVNITPQSLCGLDLYNGILMRYVTGSSKAYLGKQEDSLDFDITYYRSKDPKSPRLFEDVLEEIEQMAVFKYGGLPHWGKNRNVAFEGAIKKYRKARKFMKVREKFDPLGLFSSEWTDQVLGLKGGLSIVKEGCALEGLCVCSEDIHCAPEKGYLCRSGKVFEDARVCTLVHQVKEADTSSSINIEI